MTPQYRIEQYLAAINAAYLGDSPLPEYPAEPVWRIERFLAAILSAVKGDSPVMACPDPVWHIEEFARAIYDALTGASPAWPCPTATNNIEAILHAIYKVVADGTETDGIATSWDIERWLLDSYDAAKEGGGTKGNLPLVLANALSHAIVSLTRYGLCTQDGTPTPSAPVDIMCNNGTLKWDSVNQRVYADGTSANLYDPSKRTDNVGIFWDKRPYISTGMCYSAAIPVEQGKTYYYRLILGEKSPGVQAHRFIQIYDNDNEPSADNPAVDNPQYIIRDNQASVGAPVAYTFSTNNPSVKFVRLSLCMSDSFVMFSEYDAPYYPYHNGELVIVKSYGENLVNAETNIAGYYINSSGKITAGADSQYTDLIPVTPGEEYVWTLMSNRQAGGNNRWHGYDSSGNWVGQIAYKFSGQGTDIPFELSAIIPSRISYVRLSYGIADVDVSLGNCQYQFATVPTLLSVGDVKDEVELIAGTYTHRCAACLYDGTQDVGDTYLSTTGGKDIGAIIVYPLATPTTEQITAQNLVTNEGTNVVDSVANVGPLTAEVTYKANA